MSEFTKVATLAEVPPGRMKAIKVDGAPVVLANVDGELHAFGGACTHDEGPLEEGDLDGFEVTCPWHFSVFDIRTGEVVESPAAEGIRTFEIKSEGDDILLGPVRMAYP
jgi:nitrite reductase/ring-hydroxylating ferredoxin subunit